MPDDEPIRSNADVSVTANAAEFELENGIRMLGIFHVRCQCQPTASLAAPINLQTMAAVCRFCGAIYRVQELSLKADIHHVVSSPTDSSMN